MKPQPGVPVFASANADELRRVRAALEAAGLHPTVLDTTDPENHAPLIDARVYAVLVPEREAARAEELVEELESELAAARWSRTNWRRLIMRTVFVALLTVSGLAMVGALAALLLRSQ